MCAPCELYATFTEAALTRLPYVRLICMEFYRSHQFGYVCMCVNLLACVSSFALFCRRTQNRIVFTMKNEVMRCVYTEFAHAETVADAATLMCTQNIQPFVRSLDDDIVGLFFYGHSSDRYVFSFLVFSVSSVYFFSFGQKKCLLILGWIWESKFNKKSCIR